jgi:hypothetical protein
MSHKWRQACSKYTVCSCGIFTRTPLVLLMNPKFLMQLLHLSYRHQSLALQFTLRYQLFAPWSHEYWSSNSLPQPLLWQYCTTYHNPKKESKFKVHFLPIVCHFHNFVNLKNLKSNHYKLETSVVVKGKSRFCILYMGLNPISYENNKVGRDKQNSRYTQFKTVATSYIWLLNRNQKSFLSVALAISQMPSSHLYWLCIEQCDREYFQS